MTIIYPLAHDLEGNPISVPVHVAFWRVRRQPNRQGRPGRVCGLDGSPLCVPVDATADDMRAEGCGPDKYRLDGLDVNKQPVDPQVVAFTEIVPTEADLAAKRAGSSDPAAYRMAESLARAVDSLAKQEGVTRMVESWQRSQQEIMMVILDGKLPPRKGSAQAETLKDKIEEFRDIRRLMEPSGIRNAKILTAESETESESAWEKIPKLITSVSAAVKTPAVQAWIANRAGVSPEQAYALAAHADDDEGDEDDDVGDGGEEKDGSDAGDAAAEEPMSSAATPSTIEIPAEFAPVVERLTADERAAIGRLAAKLDLNTLQKLAMRLRPLALEEQVKKVRKIVRDFQNKEIASAHRAVFGALSDSDPDVQNNGAPARETEG